MDSDNCDFVGNDNVIYLPAKTPREALADIYRLMAQIVIGGATMERIEKVIKQSKQFGLLEQHLDILSTLLVKYERKE